MGFQLLTRLTLRLLPPLLLLSAGWTSQGSSSSPFKNYIKDKCGMSRVPDITVRISYTYHHIIEDGLQTKVLNQWATVNIQDFKYPCYELQNPTMSQSDLRKFENTVQDGDGVFILRAEAETPGQRPKSVMTLEAVKERREYLTIDFILLYINPQTLEVTLQYRMNRTEVGFHPFSSIPNVALYGFISVICEDPADATDSASAIFNNVEKYMSKMEL